MKSKILQKTILLSTLILAVSLPLAADDYDGFGRGKKGPHDFKEKGFGIHMLKGKLDLTDEQVDLLNNIKDEVDTKRIEKRPEKREMHKFMTEQILSDELDIKAITKKFDEKKNEMEEIKEYMIEKMAEFHKTLTTEQKEKIVEHMERFADKHEGRGHRGPKGFFFFH